MKEIKLANNKGITFIDDEDYEWLNQYKWQLTDTGYAKMALKGKTKRMHRFIMKEPDGLQIDHIDGNKLNNQKSNLRFATKSQNAMNSKNRINTTSKFKGVSKWRNKWFVKIQLNKKQYYLGVFKDENEAAEAYNKVAKELFGEYAKLNIIKKGDVKNN